MPDLTCSRCQRIIFAAENPVRVPGGDYHQSCFKCKGCDTKLSLKTYTSKHGEAWCKTHIPADVPHQVIDVTAQGQLAAPKAVFSGRSITEKGGDQTNNYGAGAVVIETASNAPKPVHGGRTLAEKGADQGHKHGMESIHIQGPLNRPVPPTDVDRVNMMELRHQSVEKYSSAP
jgi:hypothetical protein